MSILWMIIIGFLAGVVAKFIMPGNNEPSGFIMTTILGIAGSFLASYLGKPSAGTRQAREPVSSVRSLAHLLRS